MIAPRSMPARRHAVRRGPDALPCLSSALACLVLAACGASDPVAVASAEFTPCPKVRPEVCGRIYKPVCATRAAEPAGGWKTYPNACMACSDPAVQGYVPGACPKQ
jgi:hypothetical protein